MSCRLSACLPQACSSPDCPSTTAVAVLLGDVDGDGWLDVVVGNDGDPNVVLRSNERGGFALCLSTCRAAQTHTRAR